MVRAYVGADTILIAQESRANDRAHHLVLIQQMWRELQATRKDPVQYDNLAERIRKEADLVRRLDSPPKPEP
jgi:hypothetical protein